VRRPNRSKEEEMNREELIRMAREAGFFTEAGHCVTVTLEMAERFAALVAAAEREACAQLVIDLDGGLEWVAKEIRSRT
jgi:hypothetical protein